MSEGHGSLGPIKQTRLRARPKRLQLEASGRGDGCGGVLERGFGDNEPHVTCKSQIPLRYPARELVADQLAG